jgi:hypothetical protein
MRRRTCVICARMIQGPAATPAPESGNDGSTWEIHGKNAVNLADHVGQTVEAKGIVSHVTMHNMKEDAKQMGNDAGIKNNTAEHGHFKVTDPYKVGGSCEQ